jgi:hypothetical protein
MTSQEAIKFIKGIVCRFRVSNRIIANLGSWFSNGVFEAYFSSLDTKICYESMSHPRSNGQVEMENAEVLRDLRTKPFDKIKQSGKNWIEGLTTVLWSLRTTASQATRETTFSLVYGVEVVLPLEAQIWVSSSTILH